MSAFVAFPGSSQLGPHHERLRAILRAVREIDLRGGEVASSTVAFALVPKTIGLVHEGLEVLAGIETALGSSRPPDGKRIAAQGDFFEHVDVVMAERPDAAASDLTELGRWELRGCLAKLDVVRSGDSNWKIIAVCESARRRFVKLATALDRALRERSGELPGTDPGIDPGFVTELSHALEIRRSYRLFWTSVCSDVPPPLDDVYRRVRLAAVQIAFLIGRESYPQMRILDRFEFRRLQSEILDWARRESPEPVQGLRIWHDLNAFAGLLRGISSRSELVEHDRVVLQALRAVVLDEGMEDAEFRAKLAAARRCLGRDEELDRLLLCDEIAEFRANLRVLDSVLVNLEGTGSAVPRVVERDVTLAVISLVEQRNEER